MPESAHWLGGAGWVVVEPEGFFWGGKHTKNNAFPSFFGIGMGA